MRTFDVEFSWNLLYTWISLIEQWPYRMCWIIEYCCSDESMDVIPYVNFDNNLTISEFYLRIRKNICLNCTLASELDRNVGEFELLLFHKRKNGTFSTHLNNIGNSAKQQQHQQAFEQQQLHQREEITIGHVRVFSSCTSNLDPYLRKQVREMCITVQKTNKDLIDLKNDINSNDETSEENVFKLLGAESSAAYLFGDESLKIWSSMLLNFFRLSYFI